MKRFTYLSDLRAVPHTSPFPAAVTAAARAALCRARLRWDNQLGRMRSTRGELERLSVQSEHVPHSTPEEVMRWEFSRQINNAASRLHRGLSAH